MVTGEVGAGKTVAIRAALAGLDASRHTTIYLGNPAVGGRGLYSGIITALGGVPRFHKAALIPQTSEMQYKAATLAAWPAAKSWSALACVREASLADPYPHRLA